MVHTWLIMVIDGLQRLVHGESFWSFNGMVMLMVDKSEWPRIQAMDSSQTIASNKQVKRAMA